MNKIQAEQIVVEVVGLVLGREVPATLGRHEDPGWDSLKHMEIVFALEARLQVQFAETDIPRMDSIPRIVDCLTCSHGP